MLATRQPLLIDTLLCIGLVLFLVLNCPSAWAKEKPPATTVTTTLSVHNRSEYKMAFVIWNNGKNCSNKMIVDPGVDINTADPKKFTVPAGQAIAIGVGIFDMRDQLPVVCDYIVSFTLQPSVQYLLNYDIHNRRCFAQLFRSENDVFQMIIPGDKEDLQEKVPEFGWDQFEPACTE